MEATTTPSGATPLQKPEPQAVSITSPSGRASMARKNRWKRRGVKKSTRRMALMLLAGLILIASLVAIQINSKDSAFVPEGAFAQALYEAFPEADPERIETFVVDSVPQSAILHLPAHLIEPALGSDPFLALGSQFGGAERTLSGVDMGTRIEAVASSVLRADVPRCYTYKVGGISSAPESPRSTRALHIRLNPFC